MPIDPLSDVLSLFKPRTYVAGGLDLGGDWAVQFEAHTGIKCYAVVAGGGWLSVEGEEEPVRLDTGDCVLLPNGRRFLIAKDLAFAPIPFGMLRCEDWLGGIARVNAGGETVLLAGHFAFSGAHADLLLGAMPPVIRLRDDSDKAGLHWALARMRQELTEPKPGSTLVAEHLAHLILVQALRIYLAQGVGRHVGWLFALADPHMAAAIGAIHAAPGTRWTLPVLAKKAGMSRSKFAEKFKATTGRSPIDYLAQWRMLLACDRLATRNEPVSVIAASLGYESESAFSTAFKRVVGCSPRRYSARLGD